MRRSAPLILLVIALVAVLLVSLSLRAWGGVAFALVAGVGIGWYRLQVARSATAEKFFGDMGEETRLTGFQAGPASELPPDRAPPNPPAA